MPHHAGFASVIILRLNALQQILFAAAQAGKVPRRLDGSAQIPATTFTVHWHFFVDSPTLALASGIPGEVILTLRGWGPVSLVGGPAAVEGNARFDAVVRCPLGAGFDETRLQIRLDTAKATVEDFRITALGNDVPRLDILLDNPELRAAADAKLLQIVCGTGAALTPELDLNFISDVFSTSDKSAVVRAFDAAVAVGVDVQSDRLATRGSVSAITDFAGSRDIAVYSHRALIALRFAGMQTFANSEIASQGATLDRLDISPQSGYMAVSGHVSKTGGQATFSMELLPCLTRTEVVDYWPPLDEDRYYPIQRTVHHPELWLEPVNLSLDIDRAPWVVLLEILAGVMSFGIATAIIEDIIAGIRSQATRTLERQGAQGLGIPTERTITMPGAPGIPIRLNIEQWEIDPEGSLMGMALTVTTLAANAPTVRGDRHFAIDELPRAALDFSVDLPMGICTEDPLLKASWILRRCDLNQVVRANDGPVGSQLTFRFPFPAELFQVPKLTLSYRLYRPLGAHTDELYDATIDIGISDRLDRSRPFVRWRHPVFVPQVVQEEDGTQTMLPAKVVDRHSVIHRTDFPGRCRTASKYSWRAEAALADRRTWGQAADPRLHPSELVYLDDLPFPRTELIARRDELCDYCFFGGPDKNLPRSDLPVSSLGADRGHHPATAGSTLSRPRPRRPLQSLFWRIRDTPVLPRS